MPIYNPIAGVAAGIAEGRISISSSVSLPQGGGSITHPSFAPDTDAENTSAVIYYTPYIGNRISLFDGIQWNLHTFDSNSSFSLTGAGANLLYDMFAYLNNGVVALEIVSWGTNTAYNITAVSVGANTTITFTEPGGTQPFAVDDVVELQGLAGTSGTVLHGAWAVAAVGGSGTSRTVTLNSVNTTGLTYTGLGTIRKQKNTRATALGVQDGIYVKSGDATRKYLGTFRTTGAGQLTEDNRARRLIWNYYNRRPRSLLKQETTDNWTYGSTTASWRAGNNNALNRVEFVCGLAEDPVRLESSLCYRGPAPSVPPTDAQYTVINAFVLAGVGINQTGTNSYTADGLGYLGQMSRDAYTNLIFPGWSSMSKTFAGYNFGTFIENAYVSRAGTVCTVYGLAQQRAAGISGTVWG